jgi:ketosteroid isomerase-like protein
MNGSAVDEQQVWAAQRAMYDGFLAGDPDAVDAHLHPDATIWLTETLDLVRGTAGLDERRAQRPSGDGVPKARRLDIEDPVTTFWGEDTALTQHFLRVRYSGDAAPEELMRVSGAWRLIDERWVMVANHEEQVEGGTPRPDRTRAQ